MNKNNFYLSLYKKIEGIQSHRLETISYVLYILTTIFVAFFHEPWFDEFQAWGISKASLYSIFFQIPHFEGHPPLWHLVLKCFTSFNIHPELAIKIPNLLFMYIAVWLVVFKSPFSRLTSKSDYLLWSKGCRANAPALFPDCHIHKPVSDNLPWLPWIFV